MESLTPCCVVAGCKRHGDVLRDACSAPARLAGRRRGGTAVGIRARRTNPRAVSRRRSFEAVPAWGTGHAAAGTGVGGCGMGLRLRGRDAPAHAGCSLIWRESTCTGRGSPMSISGGCCRVMCVPAGHGVGVTSPCEQSQFLRKKRDDGL